MPNAIDILVCRHVLSDGSTVFDVQIGDERTQIPAITLTDATDLADKIAEAIRAHSNSAVRISNPY